MTNKKYRTCGIIPKTNIEMEERGKIDVLSAQKFLV